MIRRAALGHATSNLDLKVRGVRGFASAVPKQGCAFWAWARFVTRDAASTRRRAALEANYAEAVARVLELRGLARGGAARKRQRHIQCIVSRAVFDCGVLDYVRVVVASAIAFFDAAVP